jgi:hypothetical protein
MSEERLHNLEKAVVALSRATAGFLELQRNLALIVVPLASHINEEQKLQILLQFEDFLDLADSLRDQASAFEHGA